MVAPPQISPAEALRRTRLVWIAELCLIPLSNNVVAFITWKTSLDLFPVLAAVLYTYIGIRHLRILPFGFVWNRRSLMIGTLAGLALAAPAAEPGVAESVSRGVPCSPRFRAARA